MSYPVYKIIHLVGVIMVFVSLGGLVLHMINQGDAKFKNRRFVMITHGVGMAVALVGGFGLMARIGITTSWPLWLWLKLAIWFVLGGAIAFILRKPSLAKLNWALLFVIAGVAVYLANFKPE